ncbi:MAG: MerR family transcriptional regulator, partial [Egicoccus sp.]
MSYSIGEVARFAGVTVRTLHHYDAIGLLAPSRRTGSGRRGYEPTDLDRLQRILFYRELDLPLDDIAGLLDDDEDPLSHLARQRDALQDRIGRLERLVTVLERTVEARTMGINLDPDEMFEVFGDVAPGEHLAERSRLQIHEWFYDCPHAVHINLGQMYVDDPRFLANYEQQREGLAVWIR